MKIRSLPAALVCAAITLASVSGPATAGIPEGLVAASSLSRAKPSVELRLPQHVVEGDRYVLSVRTRAKKVRRLEVQQQVPDIFGDLEWTPVRSLKPKGRSVIDLKMVAGELNRERFRAVAILTNGKSARSKAAAVRVWHWTDLTNFDSYYATSGVSNSRYSQFSMNGHQYRGWSTYGSYGMWEGRYTPGRHCTAFRGVFGVIDASADGSSAQITIAADDKIVYESPILAPGAVTRATIPLSKPYRLSIQAQDTSSGDLWSRPAIGDAQLLCTGF